MIDLKKYSIKECIEHAIYGKCDSPLIIGTNNKKVSSTSGKITFSQSYTYKDCPFSAWSTYYDLKNNNPNQEFIFTVKTNQPNQNERSYPLHYLRNRFTELIELTNCGIVHKIKKDGTRYIERKRYEFKDRTLRMNVSKREYTWYYKSHRHMTKINRNKTTEHYINFKEFNVDIREDYNSKGVCTRSLLHTHDGRSIQIHLKKGIVSLFCQDGARKNCTIMLPYLKDASVLNLYDIINCFNLDLMLPNNSLFIAYTSSLRLLKQCIQNCLNKDTYINPVLRTMLENIEEYEKKN